MQQSIGALGERPLDGILGAAFSSCCCVVRSEHRVKCEVVGGAFAYRLLATLEAPVVLIEKLLQLGKPVSSSSFLGGSPCGYWRFWPWVGASGRCGHMLVGHSCVPSFPVAGPGDFCP